MRLFVNNLTNIDFSYLHSERGLVGETWLASVELTGDLDEQGMVCDFGDVKSRLRNWLNNELDHRLLLPVHSEHIKLLSASNSCSVEWHFGNRYLTTSSPNNALAFIPTTDIREEAVAAWCIEQLMPQFPNSVKKLELTFKPEEIDGPYYHYSHGLKKHDGDCQRIAHGHRSRIKIWRNQQESLKDMKDWARKWNDIYLATREDLLVEHNNNINLAFQYQAQQGEFRLSLPKESVYLIDTDSTVEFIAQYIARQLKKENPSDSFVVKAFEGLGKGAIAES